MTIKSLLGACLLAASIAFGAAGSASALIYEQVYTGTVRPAIAGGGLFGGLVGGEAFSVRFVTDTSLGSGIVDGPDGLSVEGGESRGTSAPTTVSMTVNGYTLNFTDHIAIANAKISSSASQLEVRNALSYSGSSTGEMHIFAGAAGDGSVAPVTFAQSYEISSFTSYAPYVFVLGVLNDHGFYLEMEMTSAYGRVISAVPEPSTWAMMICGLGGLGAVLRRKRLTLA